MLHFVDVQPSLRDDVIRVLHTCNILHHRYTSYEYTVRGTFFWGAFVPERNLSKMSHHWRQAWWFSRLTSLIMIALENNWLARTFPIQLISHQLNSPTNWLFWMGIHTTVVLNTKPHNRKDVKTSRFLTLTQYFCVKHVEEPYLKSRWKIWQAAMLLTLAGGCIFYCSVQWSGLYSQIQRIVQCRQCIFFAMQSISFCAVNPKQCSQCRGKTQLCICHLLWLKTQNIKLNHIFCQKYVF